MITMLYSMRRWGLGTVFALIIGLFNAAAAQGTAIQVGADPGAIPIEETASTTDIGADPGAILAEETEAEIVAKTESDTEAQAEPAVPVEDEVTIVEPAVVVPAVEEPEVTEPAIQALIENKSLDKEQRFGVKSERLIALYKSRQYEPIWLSGGDWDPKLSDLKSAIRLTFSEGLMPSDYDIKALTASIPATAEAMAETDYRITAAYMRLALDLEEGRHNYRYTTDLVELAQEGLAAADLVSWYESLLPQNKYYQDLRKALSQYRNILAKGDLPELPTDVVLKPGIQSPTVAMLRDLLINTGDLKLDDQAQTSAVRSDEATSQVLRDASIEVASADEAAAVGALANEAEINPAHVYDDIMLAAVKNFQKRHNLSTDGVIGPATFRELNTSADFRILQIKANMERLRWEFDPENGRYIRVHMGSYKLTAFNDHKPALEMPVVVGKPSRPTPVLADKIVTLKFRPDWTVPSTIFRNDYLPRMQANPGWAQSRGFQVLYRGKQINPYVAARRGLLDKVTLRQPPSNNGALGGVRFSLTNDMAIYLHDTNSKSYFSRDQRALSSGCVRVGNPVALARYVMNDPSHWNESRVSRYMNSGSKSSYIKVDEPVPVFLSYITVWVGENGTLQFQDDFYSYDNELMLKMI